MPRLAKHVSPCALFTEASAMLQSHSSQVCVSNFVGRGTYGGDDLASHGAMD